MRSAAAHGGQPDPDERGHQPRRDPGFSERAARGFRGAREQPFAYADRELQMTEAAPGRRMMEPVRLARLVHALPLGPDAKAHGGRLRQRLFGCGSRRISPARSWRWRRIPELAALARDDLPALGAANVTVVEAKLRRAVRPTRPSMRCSSTAQSRRCPDTLVAAAQVRRHPRHDRTRGAGESRHALRAGRRGVRAMAAVRCVGDAASRVRAQARIRLLRASLSRQRIAGYSSHRPSILLMTGLRQGASNSAAVLAMRHRSRRAEPHGVIEDLVQRRKSALVAASLGFMPFAFASAASAEIDRAGARLGLRSQSRDQLRAGADAGRRRERADRARPGACRSSRSSARPRHP